MIGLDNSLGGDLEDDSTWSDRDEFRSPEELVMAATEEATVTEFPFIGLLTVAEDDGERDCSNTFVVALVVVVVVVDISLLSPPFSLSLQSDG